MIRVLCLLVALCFAACGGEETAPANSAKPKAARTSGNRAPVIDSVRFVPDAPGVGDVLSVAVRAIDPDGDRIDVEVDWYRNGSIEQSGPETRLETEDFNPGDRVWAEVWVSDGEEEVTHTTGTISFENQAPDVLAVRIVPAQATGADTLLVESRTVDKDGDPYELHFRWYINGELLADATGASLEPGRARRGDEVEVEVSAGDAGGEGEWIRSPVRSIRNSPPVILSQPSEASVSAGSYRYQLKAEDPDGDRPLRYSLVDGPPGLRVDLISGLVSWQVPDGKGGGFPIRVSVADPHGAKAEQDYTLTLSWDDVPASARDGDESQDENRSGVEDADEDRTEPDADEAEDADEALQDDEDRAEE